MSDEGFTEEVGRVVREVLGPLLIADGGGVELVGVDPATREIVLRFTGRFAACPGTPAVREELIEPLLVSAAGGRARFRYLR
jgi:Fe-S cluster biogenesis protein NfuA